MKPETSNRDDRRHPPASMLLAVLCGALLVAGCATETKYKWLSRFFDGVPAPGSTNVASRITDPDYQPLPGQNTNVVVAAAQPAVTPTLHPPYHDGQCTECHESKFSQKMKGPINKVCFSCHDDFLEHAKVKHSPAESGDCLSCHNPHESLNKKLLVRVGAAMCLECHESSDIEKVAAHKATPDRDNCIACHDPHGSANPKLLKTAAVKIPAGNLPESPPATPAK